MPTWSTEQAATTIPSHITQALLSADNSSEALRNLYQTMKQMDDKYSIPYLCRRAGIPSPGYFSDVMKGKRRLHIKYRDGIVRAFGLRGAAAKYLRALISIDNEKATDKVATLRAKLPSLRKMLTIVRRHIDDDLKNFFFALEVFCAFGMYGNVPRLSDIASYFSSHTSEDIAAAIAILEKMRLVQVDGDKLSLLSTQVDFAGENVSQIAYLKMAFAHGVQSLNQWYEQPSVSLFSSTNISVKKNDYVDKLLSIRDRIEVMRSELETDDADMLVRLNVQIYPVT